MGTKHHSSSDPAADTKRRRRAGFSKIDPGIEPNECIKIYLVSGKDEVDSSNAFQVEPVELNPFFEDDGKIYGYKGLKITVWLSSISFHSYADISFESTSDGGKGITNLKSSLQNIFGESLVETKDDFLQTFSTECNYVKTLVTSAEVLPKDVLTDSSGNSIFHFKEDSGNVEIFRVSGAVVGELYSRLVPLVLLLIDGSNPIDIVDPQWEIYILVQNYQQGEFTRLLGFAAAYRFHRYPQGTRLRLGQILTMPPYQRRGYGGCLLKALYNIATSDDEVYDLSIEEPVDSLQHVRTCIDVKRLLDFNPIHEVLSSVVSQLKLNNLHCGPTANIIDDVRKCLKINKRQFLQCWEILIYLGLEEKYVEGYKGVVLKRVKADVVGRESEGVGKCLVDIPTEFDGDMSFAMFKSGDGEGTGSIEKEEDQGNQEEQLNQLVEERMKAIKSVVEKVAVDRL